MFQREPSETAFNPAIPGEPIDLSPQRSHLSRPRAMWCRVLNRSVQKSNGLHTSRATLANGNLFTHATYHRGSRISALINATYLWLGNWLADSLILFECPRTQFGYPISTLLPISVTSGIFGGWRD